MIYGFPKIHKHKARITLRQIISEIETALFNIIKSLANIFPPFLDTISNSHIKNSGDLLSKINNKNEEIKSVAVLDIASFYTNIPFNKFIKRLEIHLKKTNVTLALPVNKIIKISTSDTKNCFYKFHGTFYKRKFDLPTNG